MSAPLLLDRPPGLLNAAHLAQVVSLSDPEKLNRVQIKLLAFDRAPDEAALPWARVVSAFAGANRGAFLMPDVGDEVLVLFQHGDPRHPLVVGGLWNGKAPSPAALDDGVNRNKVIRSKNGVKLTMDDADGKERFILETPGGQKLTLQDGPSAVLIEDSNGNSVKLESGGITITASANVTVNASKVNVSAGLVNVDAAMAKFSATVKCETLIATSVVSTSYTPGAGNIW